MTELKIKEIYKKFCVPKNIIAHMEKVAYVCDILANSFSEKDLKINESDLRQAALLHDVLRVIDIRKESLENLANSMPDPKKALNFWLSLKQKYQALGHEKAMAKYLESEKENNLANLISKHGFFEINNLKTLEEKILYYSDKRVDHDKIVSLEKRFTEGRKRNMSNMDDFQLIEQLENSVFKLEKELEKLLGKNLPI